MTSKFSLWCRAAEQDTYIMHSNANKLDPPIWQKPPRHLRNIACDPDFKRIKEKPWLDEGVKEILYGLSPLQLSFSDWYHHGANRTNALDRIFWLINQNNICTWIHHRKKKSNKMKQFNTSVKEAGAIEKLAPFIIFLFLPFTVLWLIKPFLRLMEWSGAPQFSRFDAAFNSIWESLQNPGRTLTTIFLKHW